MPSNAMQVKFDGGPVSDNPTIRPSRIAHLSSHGLGVRESSVRQGFGVRSLITQMKLAASSELPGPE
jgi:hypothetical protein